MTPRENALCKPGLGPDRAWKATSWGAGGEPAAAQWRASYILWVVTLELDPTSNPDFVDPKNCF